MENLQNWMISLRRDLHKHAEPGWFEFRTSSIIGEILSDLGYTVMTGLEIIDKGSVMGRDEISIPEQIERAIAQGAKKEWIDRMGSFSGVVGIMETGRPGPVISLRFDIDAVEVNEAADENHRPYKEGFSSINPGVMHSCGHDGHTAIGLGLAKLLMEKKDTLKGTIKLIFQPAEEGVRGAKAMEEKGILDDSDYFIALHLGMGFPSGMVVGGSSGFLCTTKFDIEYKGRSAHAGAAPNEGHNALLAAANATLNMHAIAPHRGGASRINVGILKAGEGRNVIPPRAFIKAETRGQTEEIDSYMFQKAYLIAASSAKMYEVEYSITTTGRSITTSSDRELVDLVVRTAGDMPEFREVDRYAELGGSDDAAWMMKRVQDKGGKATYIMLGADIAAGHHNEYFDFDESILITGVRLLSHVLEELHSID